jgi:Tfp pilus assembly protein PilN
VNGSYFGLNLARRPFVNSRPVTRVALLLGGAGLLLLLGNVSLFWSYFAGSENLRGELRAVREQSDTERETIARLEGQVASLDLGRQNEQVEFLNGKIAERTFSWSLLFDRLAAVLPGDVRLARLTPTADERRDAAGSRRTFRSGRRGEGGAAAGERVNLELSGEARNYEALLRFVDNLFSHPAFEEPNLTREDRDDDGLITFNLEVVYLPGTPDAAAATATAATAALSTASAPGAPGAPIVVEEDGQEK